MAGIQPKITAPVKAIKGLALWSVPAEQSGDGALDVVVCLKDIQSGVALRLPPRSK